MKKIAVLNDIHFPYQHHGALELAFQSLKEEKPDAIVVNGDLLDFPGLSRYEKVPDFIKTGIREELAMGESFLKRLRKEHPKADIYYVEGNHDFRIKSYAIQRAPGFFSYIDLSVDLDFKGYRIKWVGTKEGASKWTDTFFNIDEDLAIGHFDTVNSPVIPAGMTVRNIMQKKITHSSVVQGHIHRAAIVYERDELGKIRFGLEVPCLCQDPHYRGIANWERGMAYIDKTKYGWRPRVLVF